MAANSFICAVFYRAIIRGQGEINCTDQIILNFNKIGNKYLKLFPVSRFIANLIHRLGKSFNLQFLVVHRLPFYQFFCRVDEEKKFFSLRMRIHLPEITCALLRPPTGLPKNQLMFEFPRHVNKIDIKNYLSSVYGLNVAKVNTAVPRRRRVLHPNPHIFHKHPSASPYLWLTMRKVAYVTLEGGGHDSAPTFEYPAKSEVFTQRDDQKEKERKEDVEKRIKQIQLFRDQWNEVVEERYMGLEKLSDEICPRLEVPLANLKLDDESLVKGQAKTRLHLNSIGKARKPGKSDAVINFPVRNRHKVVQAINSTK